MATPKPKADGMTHLARSPEEKQRMNEPISAAKSDAPDYPYGTELELNHEHLASMGYGEGKALPESDTPFTLHGKGFVKRSETESVDGEKRHRMVLQLTHARVDHDGDKDGNADDDEPTKPGQGVRKDLEAAFSKSAAKTNAKDASGKSRGTGAPPGTDGK